MPRPRLQGYATNARSADQFFNRVLPDAGSGLAEQDVTAPMRQSVWVMRAIKLIAQPIASASLKFSEASGRKRETEVVDPILERFWARPAVGLTYADTIEAMGGWLKLKGEAFLILGDEWLLPFPDPAKLQPFIVANPGNIREVVRNGQLAGWQWTDDDHRTHALLPEQVVQIKSWNPYNRWRGLSEWESAKLAAETDYLAGALAKDLMRNKGELGPVISSENPISDEQAQQIAAQLRIRRQRMVRGDFAPVFLTGKVNVSESKPQALDVSTLAQRLQNRHEIYIAFGVPPSMADLKQSYSLGKESDQRALITDTCQPTAAKLCGGFEPLAAKLAGRPVSAWVDWDEHPVMQEIRQGRIESARKLWDMGVPLKLANQYLDMALPEIPGWEIGYLPFSVAPTGSALPEADPALAEPESADAVEQMMVALRQRQAGPAAATAPVHECGCDVAPRGLSAKELATWRTHMAKRRESMTGYRSAVQRVLFEARKQVLAKIEAGKTAAAQQRTGAAADFLFDLREIRDLFMAAMRNQGRKALDTAASQAMAEFEMLDDVWSMPPAKALEFLAKRENKLAGVPDEVFDQVRGSLQDGLDAGESTAKLSERVRGQFNNLAKYRADRIAQTEVACAYGFARQESMQAAGITRRRWLTSGNNNVRATHQAAHGQERDLNEPFQVGGAALMFPGDPDGPAEEVINCHCVVVAIDPED
jgi:SPP1 gp7 family putative phage head morphogenesis protein